MNLGPLCILCSPWKIRICQSLQTSGESNRPNGANSFADECWARHNPTLWAWSGSPAAWRLARLAPGQTHRLPGARFDSPAAWRLVRLAGSLAPGQTCRQPGAWSDSPAAWRLVRLTGRLAPCQIHRPPGAVRRASWCHVIFLCQVHIIVLTV